MPSPSCDKKMQGVYRSGEEGGKSLLSGPGSELRLGAEQEKRRAKIKEKNGMKKSKSKYTKYVKQNRGVRHFNINPVQD